jgi:hypothetical protein
MTGDDKLAWNKLLVWHDSVGEDFLALDSISFEIVKTHDNHSPIWIQIEEKENLNTHVPLCEILEADSKRYYSQLRIRSNNWSLGLPELILHDNWESDFTVKYGIDYDSSGTLSGDEIKGEYEIFGVTEEDYNKAVDRYNEIYLPYTLWDLAQALCYRFSHGAWEEPFIGDYRPDKDGSCAPGRKNEGGSNDSCAPGHEKERKVDEVTHNVGARFTDKPFAVKEMTDDYGGKYLRYYYDAKVEVPIYEYDSSSDASVLIRESEYFRERIARFLFSKHKDKMTNTLVDNVTFTDIVTGYSSAGSGVTRSIPFLFSDLSIDVEPFLSIGLGWTTLNPDPQHPGTIVVDVTQIDPQIAPNTYELSKKVIVEAEVEDGWDYNYFKPGLAKATLASVSGSSIQCGFEKHIGSAEKAGQVAYSKYSIDGSTGKVDLLSGPELVSAYPGIIKIRIDPNGWFLFREETPTARWPIDLLYD